MHGRGQSLSSDPEHASSGTCESDCCTSVLSDGAFITWLLGTIFLGVPSVLSGAGFEEAGSPFSSCILYLNSWLVVSTLPGVSKRTCTYYQHREYRQPTLPSVSRKVLPSGVVGDHRANDGDMAQYSLQAPKEARYTPTSSLIFYHHQIGQKKVHVYIFLSFEEQNMLPAEYGGIAYMYVLCTRVHVSM